MTANDTVYRMEIGMDQMGQIDRMGRMEQMNRTDRMEQME